MIKKRNNMICFGSYPFDRDGIIRPIRWRVLDQRNDAALLITENGIDAKPYHDQFGYVTWEKCRLRNWLNHDFLNQAFTKEERDLIRITEVDNSVEQGVPSCIKIDGGNNTQDKLFALSFIEAFEIYFNGYEDRKCKATGYAKWHHAHTFDGYCWWWLRSQGYAQIYASCVNMDGSQSHDVVHNEKGCIRPAMWVDIKALQGENNAKEFNWHQRCHRVRTILARCGWDSAPPQMAYPGSERQCSSYYYGSWH